MIRFGSLELKSNLFLSPLAGYTNLPFRIVVREIGGVDLCTTDLVNARSLIGRNPKALKLVETNDQDRPLAVQLFGAVPGEMRDAARICEDLGFLGIALDPDRNAANDDEISPPGSAVRVLVRRTDEELMIARHVLERLGNGA